MALYAFDGTWNSEKDAGEYDRNTNVVRFKDLYLEKKFFYKGVGTKHGFLGKIAGGAFGVGGHERIEDAKKDMAKQFADDDRVSGNASCNQFNGTVKINGTSISFGPLVTTRMACTSAPANAQETAYLKALAYTVD